MRFSRQPHGSDTQQAILEKTATRAMVGLQKTGCLQQNENHLRTLACACQPQTPLSSDLVSSQNTNARANQLVPFPCDVRPTSLATVLELTYSLFRHNRSLIRSACADGLARTHKRTEPQTVVIEFIKICRHPQNLAALTSSRACASCAWRSL